MTSFSYLENNKPAALAEKGELEDFHLCTSKDAAGWTAERARKQGQRARIYQRRVKVDGIAILLHVVIVRAGKGKP